MPVGTALSSYDFRVPDVCLLANESNNICADSRQSLGKLSLKKVINLLRSDNNLLCKKFDRLNAEAKSRFTKYDSLIKSNDYLKKTSTLYSTV